MDHECTEKETLGELRDDVKDVKGRLGCGDVRFARVEAALDSLDKKMDLSIVQTTKTNGSVRSLLMWRSWVVGVTVGVGVINLPIVIFIIAVLLKKEGV